MDEKLGLFLLFLHLYCVRSRRIHNCVSFQKGVTTENYLTALSSAVDDEIQDINRISKIKLEDVSDENSDDDDYEDAHDEKNYEKVINENTEEMYVETN